MTTAAVTPRSCRRERGDLVATVNRIVYPGYLQTPVIRSISTERGGRGGGEGEGKGQGEGEDEGKGEGNGQGEGER